MVYRQACRNTGGLEIQSCSWQESPLGPRAYYSQFPSCIPKSCLQLCIPKPTAECWQTLFARQARTVGESYLSASSTEGVQKIGASFHTV